MSYNEIIVELQSLKQEKEVLSYKTFWTGEDFTRNRELTDKIYHYNMLLRDLK